MSKEVAHSCREIVTLNIGGFGINIGQTTLEQYCNEQGISMNGEKESKTQYDHSIHATFNEKSNGKYKSRSMFIDLIPDHIKLMQNIFKYNNIINKHYCVYGLEGGNTNFARGHYTIGKEIIDTITDRLRLLVEECDAVQGFIFNNSISGGTGSGVGTLCLERVAVDYRKKAKIGFHTMLDVTRSISPLEVLNSLLCMHWLMDHTDASIFFDNTKLHHDICKNKLNIKVPRYKHYNYLCNKLISNITAPWRFQLAEDMNIFVRDMVPYPRLHYLTSSLSPIVPKNVINFKEDIHSMTYECFKPDNFFYQCYDFDRMEDKYMSVKLNYRGRDIGSNIFEINKSVKSMCNKEIYWTEWCNEKPSVTCIDDKITSLESDVIYCGDKQVTMVGNNYAVSRLLMNRICKRHDVIYSQRAYVHWNVGEGMSEGEIPEAREDMGFLEKDYLDVITHQESDADDEDY